MILLSCIILNHHKLPMKCASTFQEFFPKALLGKQSCMIRTSTSPRGRHGSCERHHQRYFATNKEENTSPALASRGILGHCKGPSWKNVVRVVNFQELPDSPMGFISISFLSQDDLNRMCQVTGRSLSKVTVQHVARLMSSSCGRTW